MMDDDMLPEPFLNAEDEGEGLGNGSLALISEAIEQEGDAEEENDEGEDEEEDGEEDEEEDAAVAAAGEQQPVPSEEGNGKEEDAADKDKHADISEKEGDTHEDDGDAEEEDSEEEEEKVVEVKAIGHAAAFPKTVTTGDDDLAHEDAGGPSSTPSMLEEFVEVDLSDIRKDVQCPICLGIIRKTRTVMECLHRFCRECIDKSMRLGNNECPVCRTHCASRRSLRDDLNFDALIAALYPNVDTYEEEEFALREENERKNKQLQESIAETLERQSDAITRRCTTAKVTAAAIVRKAHTKLRNIDNQSKGKSQNYGGDEEGYMEEYEMPVVPEAATRERRSRRRKRDTATMQLEVTDDEQGDVQGNKTSRVQSVKPTEEVKGETSSGNVGRWEGLATWARAGSRSTARYGNLNNNSNRIIARATLLLEALSAATQLERDIEFDVHLTLQPFNHQDQ